MNTTSTMLGFGGLLFGLSTVGCAAELPAHSTVAFSATTSDVETLGSGPRVLATHVMPMRGVTAVAEGGVVWLRFRTTREPRVLVAVDPDTLDVVEGGTPPPEMAPGTALQVDVRDQGELSAWTGYSLGPLLTAVPPTDGDEGANGGVQLDLGYHGSAIGRAAIAVTKDCKGVLAFIESNGADSGFDLVVMRTSRCR
jgi:hypothetical protein